MPSRSYELSYIDDRLQSLIQKGFVSDIEDAEKIHLDEEVEGSPQKLSRVGYAALRPPWDKMRILRRSGGERDC